MDKTMKITGKGKVSVKPDIIPNMKVIKPKIKAGKRD